MAATYRYLPLPTVTYRYLPIHRLKSEVEKDLPPKKEIKLLIGMSDMQREWYQTILSKNIDVLNAMGGNKNKMLNIVMQLRKCANHPYLFEGAEQPPFINDERLCTSAGERRVTAARPPCDAAAEPH